MCDRIHAAVEECGCESGSVFEISLRSPEIAQRNRSDALTAAHMLCDGVMFSLYPRQHVGHSCSTLPLQNQMVIFKFISFCACLYWVEMGNSIRDLADSFQTLS